MGKQAITGAAGLSGEDLDLLDYVLAEEGVEVEPVAPVPRRAPGAEVPLSFAQQRLWFLDQLQPGNPVYNLPTVVRVTGRLDLKALERTLGEIVRRHEVLRTTFKTADGSPRQLIAPAAAVPLPVVDLSGLAADEREAEARRLTREEVLRPFDLSAGPLLRALVLRLAEQVHVVVVTMHHIISDGWSGAVLVREVGALYEAFSQGRPSPLAELPVQYADYALWQREWLRGEVLEAQLDYWRAQLQDLPMLELPFDRPRPAEQSFRGARHTELVPKAVADALNGLAQGEGATLFMALLAAFATLLSRYSGQGDVTVGTPVANRRRAELEPLIGFFVNTLVLRLKTTDSGSFRELIGRAREVCLGAYAHQDVPFEKLVEELQPERSLSHAPLFQTALVLQNVPRGVLELEGLRLEGLGADAGTVKFDLALIADETEHGLYCTFEYNTDLFDGETVGRMAAHFRRLLEAACAEPWRRPSELPLLGAQERRRILVEWNDTRREYPRGVCLHELIEEQVARTPEAVALVFEGRQLTYLELNERANRLAHRLRALGAGPDVVVAVSMERSVELVVALLGVLKAGAAYLPLDAEYPRERLEFMLEDAGAAVLLTQADTAADLPECGAEVVCVDRQWEEIAREDGRNPRSGVAANNLAYVIYTSGSTGRPKGVMIDHGGITNRLLWMQEAYGLNGSDRVLQKTPFSFDVSVWEFFWPLMTGARLVVARPGGHQDAAYLLKLIAEQGVTTLHFVPPMLKVFLEEEGVGGCRSLRRVICSGEALPVETQGLFFERLDAELHNLYGPTEASVDVTSWACVRGDARRSVPIGRPIANTQTYILDGEGQPVPAGVAGELHLGGAGLARGYLSRPALTAERFIPDPFGAEPGARLYRTGDLARYWPDGNIEFLGRLDSQVKVRGFRIEPGEIEAALASHPSVRDVAVVARDDGSGGKRLVAYMVTEGGAAVAAEEMRNYLKGRLPEYMIPAAFVTLAQMPLTPNGKLDRRALPDPGAGRPASEESYVAPRNEREDLLATIWADVLGLERVGVEDNFFALGGDSIRSVRVLARARERGLELTLQQLFRHQTVAELARAVAATDARSLPVPRSEPFDLVSAEDRAKLPPSVVDAYPLTMLQGGMLFHIALAPDAPLYHNINSWQLRAPFDRAPFAEAVARAVARHPILRTSFDLTSYSEPLQLVHESAELQLGVEDLRGLPPAAQDEVIGAYVEAEKSHAFDLARPPLLRFQVHLRGPETFQFTLTECHPIFDGWSLTTTLTEIFTDYFALLKGRALAPEPSPSVTFRDFVLMERRALESEEHQNFWGERLRGLTVTRLPRLPAPFRGADEGPRGQRIRQEYFLASPELSAGLHAVARLLKVPVKSVLLAAHLKVLSLLSGESDVVSGLVTNGRPEALDGEQVRGLFLNTVPFRLRIPSGTWSDLVRATFEAEWELLPYRRYPLPALQRRAGGGPLFEAQFNFVHFHVLEGILRSGDVEVLSDGKRIYEDAHFPLTAAFGINLFSSLVNLMLQYDSAELSDEQARSAVGYYAETLRRIAEDPAARHDESAPLPAEERRRLLGEWNDTARDYAPAARLHEMFEAQAARAPGAVAVVAEAETLTYGELNRRANQLAHHLRSLGVGPEVRVGVLLERSAEMVVGLLGVLKAGGAYVPLDPDYPAERLRFMLEDCGASLLLTEQRLLGGRDMGAARVTCLDADREEITRQGDENPAGGATPDNLAYMIYTSGSTGRPKGVMISHRAICNHMLWMAEQFPLGAADAVLQKTPFSFDASVWEFHAPLMAGARLVMARPGGHQDSSYLASAVRANGVTVLQLVPSMLRIFLAEPGVADCTSLRHVFCGGEEVRPEDVETFNALLPRARLHNLYGPTEAAIDATHWECEPPAGEAVPIGRPLANVRVYVLDSRHEPAPVGVNGELYIGGVGLARGYHGRPALTAERFVPDPFSAEPGARLYRTGDLARRLPGGPLEFRGRADSQVKLHGFRIEVGEIEAALTTHPSVRECAVAPRGEGLDAVLVAYLVAAGGPGTAPDASELREHLGASLPRHMIPAAFVTLERLPRMPSGKVDRRALPAPGGASREASPAAFVAPRNEMERVVAGIWAEVLGVSQVGVDDNFFDLGGHSLRVLQVHLKLRQTLGRELPLVELFQHPTVSALARHLREGGEGESLVASEQRGEQRKRSSAQQQRRRRHALKAGADERG